MSDVLKRILSLTLSAVVITGCISVCSFVCNHPSEEIENTVSSFYREPDNSLDVVIIGSSAANKDLQPAVIWQQCGVTSYNFSIGACSANIYKSILKEAVSKQSNAIFVVDIDGFVVDDQFQKEKDPIRLWADSIPRNDNHKEVVNKFFADNKAERYYPFIRYHRNMTSLTAYIPITIRLLKKDILQTKDALGGATVNDKKSADVKQFSSENFGVSEMTTYSMQIFNDFISFCIDKSLKNVIFVSFPKSYNDDSTLKRNIEYSERTNYIRNAVEKYGYIVLDYNSLGNPAQLNYKTDFADTLHLTTEGAVKFSKYFGQYISENYIFSKKSDETVADWNSRTKEANAILGL